MTEWILRALRIGDYADYRTLGAARSPKWESVRKEFMKLHAICAVCSTTKDCEVHHKKPFHLDPALELDPTNFITLCRDHHYLFGHLLNWSAYNPEVDADARIYHDKIKNRL